jgi:hypothetical protein
MKTVFSILILALFLVSCGSNSSSVIIEDNQTKNFRILKVVESGDYIYTTNYKYNELNLLVEKRTFQNDTLQDIESFTYSQNRQLTLQSKVGTTILFGSVTSYKYGDIIDNNTNLPIIVSTDSNFTFAGTFSTTHIDYSYDLNEQGRAVRLDNTYLYRTSTVAASKDEEETTYYTYDEENRIIAKGDTIYRYNEFGKLASSSSLNYQTIYTYDEDNRLSFYEKYIDERLISRVEYHYEEGLYDDSGFSVNYLDQGQFISSGIY